MGDTKHYWLIAGNVIATGPKGQVGQRGLNTLVTTNTRNFTRKDMALAQDGLMRRFITETKQEKNAKIADVFLLSTSYLGEMTKAEFEDGFSAAADAAESQEIVQEV